VPMAQVAMDAFDGVGDAKLEWLAES